MPRIFISYRRTDTSTITGRIYDRLVMAFGEENVFKDVDDIPIGEDFRRTLEEEVAHCDVLCVIIGKQWVTVADSDGNRRLDDPNDFVRIEVTAGLKRPDVLVVPVLANGASMPAADEIPADLQPIRFRNAAVVRDDPDFNRDISRLTSQIKAYASSPRAKPARAGTASSPPKANSRPLIVGIALVAVVVVAIIAVMMSNPSGSGAQTSSTDTPSVTSTIQPTSTPVEQIATARENARVWTEPTVQTGTVITRLEVGSEVILIGEPVMGPIVLDSDDEGEWYQVRLPGETDPMGWMWADRLILNE